MNLPFFLLASHNDIRVTSFQQALKQQALPPATVTSYPEFIQSPEKLYQQLNQQPCILRIDSSGRDTEAHAAILEQGIQPLESQGKPFQTTAQIQQKLRQKGLIIAPPQFYSGFGRLMKQLQQNLSIKTSVKLMSHPEDIMLAFDKFTCQQRLQQEEIPIPTPLGNIHSYDDLREQMQQQQIPRVFIKLKHGSAASGIMALETAGKKIQAKTTIEYQQNTQEELALFNTRQIKRYTQEDEIRQLVNALCKMEVQVERWIPKAQVNGYTVDLRILVIAGKVQHQVLRMSKSPITNLHLLNQRAEVDLLKQQMTSDAWEAMLHSCEQVAGVFSKSLYIAVDVAVSIHLNKHFILEVNAFGDLLKEVYYKGLTPQEAEIVALKETW